MDQLGFDLVGYGCTTCIGNSGPLPEDVTKTVSENDLMVCSVLSGNRNFEGRIHPLIKANWLASPPLVVAYALAGSIKHDMTAQALGKDADGNDVYLKDIWPSQGDIQAARCRSRYVCERESGFGTRSGRQLKLRVGKRTPGKPNRHMLRTHLFLPVWDWRCRQFKTFLMRKCWLC